MLEKTASTVAHIIGELRKTIVGQDDVIEQILVALFAEGHGLRRRTNCARVRK